MKARKPNEALRLTSRFIKVNKRCSNGVLPFELFMTTDAASTYMLRN